MRDSVSAPDCIPDQKAGGTGSGMGAKLTFKYDGEGDVLYINTRAPYAEQELEEPADEIIARLTILLPASNLLRGRLASRRLPGFSFGRSASGLFRSFGPGALRRLPKLLIEAVERSLGGLPYSLAGLAPPFQRFERLRGSGPHETQGAESESQTTLPPGHGHGWSLFAWRDTTASPRSRQQVPAHSCGSSA